MRFLLPLLLIPLPVLAQPVHAVSAVTASQSVTGGIGYGPGDAVRLPGGAILTVKTTGISTGFRPPVVFGGLGCTTNNAAIFTGTTGTGTKGQVVGVVSGGSLQYTTSVYGPGSYTLNPANKDAEPVSGGSCTTPPVIHIEMGGMTATAMQGGSYEAATAPATLREIDTSGEGLGNIWAMTYAP